MVYKLKTQRKQYEFQKARSKEDLKKLIQASQQRKIDKERKRIGEEMAEATKNVTEEKEKKKQLEKEKRLAREWLGTDILETTNTGRIYDKLFEMSQQHPKEFAEIMKTNLVGSLKSKLDEHLKAQVESFQPISEDTETVVTDAEFGKILESNYQKALAVFHDKDNYTVISALPTIDAIIQHMIDADPDADHQDIMQSLEEQFGIETGAIRITKKTMDTYKQKLRLNPLPYIPQPDGIITSTASTRPATPIPVAQPPTREQIMRILESPPVPPPSGPPLRRPVNRPPSPPNRYNTRSHTGPAFLGREGDGISPNKIVKDIAKRLKILVGEIDAGNTSNELKAEVFEIIDFLYKNKKITKPIHKRITKALKLQQLN